MAFRLFTIVLCSLVLFFGDFEITKSPSLRAAFSEDSDLPLVQFIEETSSYGQKLATLGITLRPGTNFKKVSQADKNAETHCQSLVYKTLLSLPSSHAELLKDLTLYYSRTGRRGLGGGNTIILRCLSVTEQELVSVLTHEIGHLVDSSLFYSLGVASEFKDFDVSVSEDDPSVSFYRLSWEDEKTLLEGQRKIDFVSGYAMTDPFEDFAETYLFYRLHGAEFRKMKSGSQTLQIKYNFMKDQVFDGEEFGEGESEISTKNRVYDTTIVPFVLKDFLGEL